MQLRELRFTGIMQKINVAEEKLKHKCKKQVIKLYLHYNSGLKKY